MARRARCIDRSKVTGYVWNREHTKRGVILAEGCYNGHKYKVCWEDNLTVTYPDARGCVFEGKNIDGLPVYKIM